MVSGIPVVVGIGIRMWDPYVDVVFGAPIAEWFSPSHTDFPRRHSCAHQTKSFKPLYEALADMHAADDLKDPSMARSSHFRETSRDLAETKGSFKGVSGHCFR